MSTFDKIYNNFNKLFSGSQQLNIETTKIIPNDKLINEDLLFICCFDKGSGALGLNHLKSLKNQEKSLQKEKEKTIQETSDIELNSKNSKNNIIINPELNTQID